MKQNHSLQFPINHISGFLSGILLLLAVVLTPQLLQGQSQCLCQGQPIVAPGAYHYRPSYDANGTITSYGYKFQFPCIGLPLDVLDMFDEYTYSVFYREIGTSEWLLADPFITTVWNDADDYFLDVHYLKPGVPYEFTTTCPCFYGDFQCPEDQFNNFNYGNGTFEGNVLTPWTVLYCGDDGSGQIDWISNMQVDNIDFNTGTANIIWQYSMMPPSSVKAAYRPKTTPASAWIDLPDPTAPEYTLTGLTSCAEYEFKATVTTPCNLNSKTITFKFSDCAAKITDVNNISGKDATVYWEPNSLVTPLKYKLSWTIFNNIMTPDLQYTINNLNSEQSYNNATVTPICPATAQCPANSQPWKFKTICDRNEDNNSFATATNALFWSAHPGNNISPESDVDYYRFIPTCERIQIEIDHQLTQPGHGSDIFSIADLPYQLYDENQTLIPYDVYYGEHGYGHIFHIVRPGHVYYLKISKSSSVNWDIRYQASCYSFDVHPCPQCYGNCQACLGDDGNSIIGYTNITSLPFADHYYLDPPFLYTDVTWSIASGQATLVETNDPNDVYAMFEHPGTVVLTASVVNCDGVPSVFPVTIHLSDPCYVAGQYSSGSSGMHALESTNIILSPVYQVLLNLPQGTSYTWVCTSGQAYWVKIGNTIKITQSSLEATFQLRMEGDCFENPRNYTFVMPIAIDGDHFSVSPNPVTDFLQISPEKSLSLTENEPSDVFIAGLFNTYGEEIKHLEGDISQSIRFDCHDLPSGHYFLRYSQGSFAKVVPIVKIR